MGDRAKESTVPAHRSHRELPSTPSTTNSWAKPSLSSGIRVQARATATARRPASAAIHGHLLARHGRIQNGSVTTTPMARNSTPPREPHRITAPTATTTATADASVTTAARWRAVPDRARLRTATMNRTSAAGTVSSTAAAKWFELTKGP